MQRRAEPHYNSIMMKPLSLLALVLAASVPASAQAGPAARIGALIERAPQMNGVAIPPLAAIPVPPSAASSAAQAPAAADSVVPAGLWATLAAPDAKTLAWLSSRIPGLNTGAVRVLPRDAAFEIFDAAVAKGQSPLDLFTDPGFRGEGVFFLEPATLAALFARYEVRVLTPSSGTTKDGRSFAMLGFLIGEGRIDALYDLDQFWFDNPLFPEHRYKLANHVTERIQAPGDLTIEGIWLRAGILTPKIQRIVKLSPTEGRVETNFGNRDKPVTPIRRR